jgi:tol-pal system protein YbgF
MTAPVLAALLTVVAAPAAAASREQQQMMAEIRMLQEQNQRMQQQMQQMLRTLADALNAVTTKVDDQTGINRKAFADSKLIVDSVAGDLRILREKLDDTNVRISTLSQEVEALRNAVPATPPPSAYVPIDGFEPLPADPGSPVPPAAPAPAVPPGMAPQRMYDSAFSDYTAGQWSLAIAGFEGYVRAFPRSEQADDAQFYIGESYFADGKNKEALAAYEQVARDYPRGDRVPEATYKKGIVLGRLGRSEEARAAYESVVQIFPESNAGRLAKQRLDELNRSRPR